MIRQNDVDQDTPYRRLRLLGSARMSFVAACDAVLVVLTQAAAGLQRPAQAKCESRRRPVCMFTYKTYLQASRFTIAELEFQSKPYQRCHALGNHCVYNTLQKLVWSRAYGWARMTGPWQSSSRFKAISSETFVQKKRGLVKSILSHLPCIYMTLLRFPLHNALLFLRMNIPAFL